jgi:hypothetical protein
MFADTVVKIPAVVCDAMQFAALLVHCSSTYDVMSRPPFDDGAVHVTVADALPAAAATVCGTDAVVKGRPLPVA